MTHRPSRRHAGAVDAETLDRAPLTPNGLPVGAYTLVEVDALGLPVREVEVRIEGWPYFVAHGGSFRPA